MTAISSPRLLFDENLSWRLPTLLASDFPQSTHPELLRMRGASDTSLWHLAAKQGYCIVSKDDDFRQRAVLYGPPPKVVWLAIGNASTAHIADLIRSHSATIYSFTNHLESAVLRLS